MKYLKIIDLFLFTAAYFSKDISIGRDCLFTQEFVPHITNCRCYMSATLDFNPARAQTNVQGTLFST